MSDAIKPSDGRFISRLFYRILPAQIFVLLLTGLNNLVDGLVGSNFVGPEAMSAIGLYSPFLMVWLAFGSIMMVSSQVLCGRYMGAGDLDKTRGVFSLNIVVVFTIMGIATLASFVIPQSIASFLGASDVNIKEVSMFVVGRGIGLIPLILGEQFVTFLLLEGQQRFNYIATGSMLVVNIILDLLFTAYLKMGIFGLGIATSLSDWVCLAVAVSFFLTKKASLKFSWKLINWRELGGMIIIGFPSALMLFLNGVRTGLFNNALANYDPTMIFVAVFSTFSMVILISQSVGQGIASTGRMLTSVSYGEEDRRGMVLIMRTVLSRGLVIVLITALFNYLMAGAIAGFYFSDHTLPVYIESVKGIRIGSVILILMTIEHIFLFYFQALGRIKIVNIISVVEGIAIMGPLSLLLVPRMGIDGVWTAMVVGYAAAVLCVPLYSIIYWKRLPKTMSEWLTIPKDFGATDDERLDYTIYSIDDVVKTSERIMDFCQKRKIDKYRSYYSALALEELAAYIVEDRFTEDDKKHFIEVRVVHKNNDVILSVKDDCKPFNPKERSDLMYPADSTRAIGLRMIMGITKSTDYQLLLGLNAFTMVI